jgi:hypothetical protein
VKTERRWGKRGGWREGERWRGRLSEGRTAEVMRDVQRNQLIATGGGEEIVKEEDEEEVEKKETRKRKQKQKQKQKKKKKKKKKKEEERQT